MKMVSLKQPCNQIMKPPQIYYFPSIRWAILISVTNNPRVHTKIIPYDTHQPTLMSHRYSNVTASIRELIIWYASNNFRFIILNPTQRTSKSAPRFLPEKRRRERASTHMHRWLQCHLGNPWVECQNTYQVNQYDTPLSPWEFIARHTSSVLKSINYSIW